MNRFIYILSTLLFFISCESQKYICELDYNEEVVLFDCSLATWAYDVTQNNTEQRQGANLAVINCINTYLKYKECQKKSDVIPYMLEQ